MSNFRSVVALFSGACLVAGCQQVPPPPPPAPVVAPPPPVVVEAPSPPEAPPAPVLQPYASAQVPKAFANAVNDLDLGHEDQAKVELQRILLGEPNNAKAKRLMNGITADPVATLGRESFPYTVRANDSMSSIAGRFMGDILSFYILARYNGIAVPRQLAEGQTLRIPGKAPPPGSLAPPPAPAAKAEPPAPAPAPVASKPEPAAAPAPAPASAPAAPPPSAGARAMQAGQAAEAHGDLDGAYAAYQEAASNNEPGAAAKVDGVRKRLVQRNSLNARTAFAKQDLDGAIRGWESVLAVDPDNETAKLERQRALSLKAKVDSLKK